MFLGLSFSWPIDFSLMIFPGNLDEALAQLTEAILLNPQSAILYATRGTLCVCVCIPTRMERLFDKFLSVALLFVLPSVSFGNLNFLFSASIFMKLKKPNAAIRDADTALKVFLFLTCCIENMV